MQHRLWIIINVQSACLFANVLPFVKLCSHLSLLNSHAINVVLNSHAINVVLGVFDFEQRWHRLQPRLRRCMKSVHVERTISFFCMLVL